MYYCESMPLTELRGMDRSPASGVDSSEGAANPASEVELSRGCNHDQWWWRSEAAHLLLRSH